MAQYGHYGDSPSQDDDTKPHLSPLRLTMGIIMVAIYLAMAYGLLFTPLVTHTVPSWVRYVMGVVFFLYGIYRGYRVYKGSK